MRAHRRSTCRLIIIFILLRKDSVQLYLLILIFVSVITSDVSKSAVICQTAEQRTLNLKIWKQVIKMSVCRHFSNGAKQVLVTKEMKHFPGVQNRAMQQKKQQGILLFS